MLDRSTRHRGGIDVCQRMDKVQNGNEAIGLEMAFPFGPDPILAIAHEGFAFGGKESKRPSNARQMSPEQLAIVAGCYHIPIDHLWRFVVRGTTFFFGTQHDRGNLGMRKLIGIVLIDGRLDTCCNLRDFSSEFVHSLLLQKEFRDLRVRVAGGGFTRQTLQ